jgi:hypothetical protein
MVLGLSVSAALPVHAQSLPGADWSPAAGAAGDNTYQGFIDQPTPGATVQSGASFTVSGWIVDTSADGWAGIDGVQVLLGGNVLAQASVAQNRPDVASALGNPFYAGSGFQATVSSALPGGQQTLTVLAHTPGKGSWSKDVTVNVAGGSGSTPVLNAGTATSGIVLKIISPHTEDLIIPNGNGTINGIAYDTRTRAELGVGVDRVQIYLDGPRGTAGSQYLGDAVQSANTWSLGWQPTKYDSVQHHILWVYARSNVTGEEALVQEEINIARSL